MSLNKKNDVHVVGHSILLLDGSNPKYPKKWDLGIGSWGKIEYLQSLRYNTYWVSDLRNETINSFK